MLENHKFKDNITKNYNFEGQIIINSKIQDDLSHLP